MKEVIGACLGASSISMVKMKLDDQGTPQILESFAQSHNGDPKGLFETMLSKFNTGKLPLVITGRKFRKSVATPTISEPEATEYAYELLKPEQKHSAIASLGGETFIIYTLDESGKINNLITKNQCASGTGEFFLQQIKRMNLNVHEAMECADGETPFKVSGRCSVFCKSDCTHALNKGVPKAEVTSGLSQMIADKIEELLKKAPEGKFMLVGGVTQNYVVMDFVRQRFGEVDVPEIAPYFEAAGAAYYGLLHDVPQLESFDHIFKQNESSFSFHRPLKEFADRVEFKEFQKGTPKPGDNVIIGLDVGSTTTKAVAMRVETNEILASIYLYTNGDPIGASRKCYASLSDQLPKDINIIGIGTTGSGRHICGLHALTDGVINEIVAHANAAVYFDSEVDTIFEIGGQDAKYTYIVNKVPADYAMNEACSAGTGSFIEESAHESLGVKVTEIEPIAMRGETPPNFSDQCAAFISSDIKTALQEDIAKDDIIAGLVYSICLNYVNRVKGNRAIGNKIFMQGGVCYNKAIPIAMAALTGQKIIVPPEPGLMGAFGVALGVKEKLEIGLMHPSEYNLDELAGREVTYKKPFICAGGREKCDRKCPVNLIEVLGKTYPFGGACNKYYELNYKNKQDAYKYDYVIRRQKMIYEEFAPAIELPANAKSVGINQSFHTHTIYPLYYNFFTKLGFKVILSEEPSEEGIEREMTSFCYPAQLSHGLFHDLMLKKPDYIFMPQLVEMNVEGDEYPRIDFNCTCVFVNAEPYYIKQAFKDQDLKEKLIAPEINFAKGFESALNKFYEIAAKLGIKDKKLVAEAYNYGVQMQREFQDKMYEMGRQFLIELEKNPDDMAMVLVGRPYNAFTDTANKGIPRKFSSRNVYILPYDMFDYREEGIDDDLYWEGGKKILRAAKLIKKHPQLFATYISNFSCGPDSFLLTWFRNIMGTKPSLTLELDGHTADAGINTRIDAALDIIINYRKLSRTIKDKDHSDFRPAYIEFNEDKSMFVCSSGEKLPLKSKDVVILIPAMGDLAAPLFAAALRSQGYNAVGLHEHDNDVLKYGRSVASGKECLPIILLAGSLLDYINHHWDGKKKIAFFNVQGAGNCRLGQYPVFIRNMIRNQKLVDVAPLTLFNDDGFSGMGPDFAIRGIQAIIASDVLDDIRSAIMAHAYDPEGGIEIFNKHYNDLVNAFETHPKEVYKALEVFAIKIQKEIPARIPIEEAKYIAMVGEIFVRRDGFAHKWMNKQLAKKGFVLKDAYISEWLYYTDYLISVDLVEPDKSLKKKVERMIRITYMRNAEKKIKKILEKTGYYEYEKTEIEPLLDHSKHIIPLEFKGEPGLTLGVGLHETLEKYCGVINIGPFGCMPTRVSEAVASPEMTVNAKIEASRLNHPKYQLSEVFTGEMSIPFLTVESDGNVFPQVIEARLETFALQADRIAGLMKKARNNGGIVVKK